jgi:DNA-binding transcriptional regulator YiaG
MVSPKEARLRLGLNQTKMAEAMGIHRQTWVKWERAERKPDNAAIRLIEALLWMHSNDIISDFLKSRSITV